MEMSGQLHAPGEIAPVPMDRGQGGSQGRSGRCEEKKNLAPVGIRTPVVRRYIDILHVVLDKSAHFVTAFICYYRLISMLYIVNKALCIIESEQWEYCINRGLKLPTNGGKLMSVRNVYKG
jgi:hypothetical protein